MVSVIKSLAGLRQWRHAQKLASLPVGLVPTMGALHAGHLDLIKQSMASNPATVVSIFVNPSQFAPNEDLDKYPRKFEADISKITEVAQTASPKVEPVVFMPSVEDMYPSGIVLDRQHQTGAFVEVLGLSHQLEGAIRPHFFRGVATVVAKLFNAVQPDRAYFGQKDIQQTVVVRRMVKDLLMPIEIVVGKTKREPNGLAMSSRNEYLSPETRQRSEALYKGLSVGKQLFDSGITDSAAIVAAVEEVLKAEPVFESIEYIEVTDLDSLVPIDTAKQGDVISAAVGLQAATGKKTRILDNIIL